MDSREEKRRIPRMCYCHRSSVRPNLKTRPLRRREGSQSEEKKITTLNRQLTNATTMQLLTHPKKMKAFWKNTAIPGYTVGFAERRRHGGTWWILLAAFVKWHIKMSRRTTMLATRPLNDSWSSSSGLTRHYESSKQDPHGGNEGAKRKHEADEEPNSSACKQR